MAAKGEEQVVRLVEAQRGDAREIAAGSAPSVFDLVRKKRRGPLRPIQIIEGDFPPAFNPRNRFAIAYDELGPGRFVELVEPDANAFKRWARENKRKLECRRIAPACWAFRKPPK